MTLPRRAFFLLLAFAAGWGSSAQGWPFGGAQRERVATLERQLAELRLKTALLKERRRVARIDVVAREDDPTARGGVRTRFRFTEVDERGHPLAPGQEFQIEGDLLYVDAQVIKFDDSFVEDHDLLRGSTLLLFRRLFGEFQAPSEGFPIDAVGVRPRAYSAEDDGAFEAALWKDFWDYANQPEIARASGVRAMHGEAPYMKLRADKHYLIELRSSEGLVIRPE